METLLQDLRYAARTLLRAPGFTLAIVLTLALGIGATTALFSAIDALLLRPLPLHEPERLVEISPTMETDLFKGDAPPFSYPAFQALGEQNQTVQGIAAAAGAKLSFSDDEYAEDVAGLFVTGNYFGLLGVSPARGRTITPADDQRGSPTAGVVLSDRLWRRRFGADPAVVGLVIGLAAAFAGSRLIESFLFGVSATDPFAFAAVTVLLAAVALRSE